MKTVKSTKKSVRKTPKSHIKRAKLAVKRARPIHHRIVLHPISVFTLLCVGVFIVSWTYRANADSYVVTAKVAAPALTSTATIDSPTDGTVFKISSTSVNGTCPPSSYVVLYRNAAMSGAAVCSSGTYTIQTSLYPNSNILKVQDFNITDDPGPSTPTITVIYDAPIIPPQNPVPNGTGTPVSGNTPIPEKTVTVKETASTLDLPLLTSNFSYKTFDTNAVFEWEVQVSGGTLPYQFDTNWGDGTTSTQKVDKAQTVRISHRYKKAGQYKVLVTLVDSAGFATKLQLVAIITQPRGVAIHSSVPTGDGEASIIGSGMLLLARHWLAVAWGSYATVTLMAVSFWLGERQKVAALIQLKHGVRHRHKPA